MFGFGLLKLWLWLRDFGARGAYAQYSPRGFCHQLHVLHECRNPMIKAGFGVHHAILALKVLGD